MDVRTSQLLTTLDPLATDLLLNLLPEALTEKELLRAVGDVPQPTMHRRLKSLAKAGMIRQSVGPDPARSLPWSVVAPHETVDLLDALFALADALDSADRHERSRARESMASVRQNKASLRLVGGDH
jgi:DNA-binding HxlR family transcriptional regulator